MTHRSRSGGPTKNRGKKNTSQRKLHHPPSASATAPTTTKAEDEEDARSFPLPARTTDPNPPDSELLALIHRALYSTISDEAFIPTVQKIKGLLYDKKWLDVFCGSESLLEAYAGRWVPSRVCCFRELMGALVGEIFEYKGKGKEVEERLGGLVLDDVQEDEEDDDEAGNDEDDEEEKSEDNVPTSEEQTIDNKPVVDDDRCHILSLGGGAGSELLAIAALIRSTLIAHPHKPREEIGRWSWTGVDIGRWNGIINKFTHAAKVDWEVGGDILEVDYIQGDLLAPTPPQLGDNTESVEAGIPSIDITKILSTKPPRLITLFFTLAELLSQSRSSTLALLSQITDHTPPGTQFLVVDSASDISQLPLGKEGRSYPIYMVIDLLLTTKGKGWEKVRGEDSRWFRFDEDTGKGWPCKLENTRYWYRLYRRI